MLMIVVKGEAVRIIKGRSDQDYARSNSLAHCHGGNMEACMGTEWNGAEGSDGRGILVASDLVETLCNWSCREYGQVEGLTQLDLSDGLYPWTIKNCSSAGRNAADYQNKHLNARYSDKDRGLAFPMLDYAS